MNAKIRRFGILLFLLLYLFIQGCTGNSPTDPVQKNEKVLSSKTIDNNGGVVKTDNMEMDIPLGAFQSSQEIKILNSAEDNYFNSNAVSDFFKVEGLPLEFSEPIKIKIKYNGSLTDSCFIAIGENNFVSSLNEETLSYHLISAKDSAGFLIAEIPPMNNQGLGKSNINYSENADDVSINIGAVAGLVDYTSPNGHFKITFPSSVLTQTYDLADYLESAYTKIKDLGFSYSKRTRWPIEVIVKRFSETDVYGYSSASIWGNNYGYLEFNFDKMDESDNMKVTAGHEFFHLVQDLYDPRSGFSKRRTPMPNFWLNEASSVWSEALFIGNPNYVSPIYELNAFEILKGAKTGDSNPNDGTITQDYGYGMSSLIKYITDKYGNSKLVEIYNYISEGKTPFQAVSSVLPIDVGFTWHSYLKSLFSFDIYKSNSFRPALLSSYATGEHQKFVIKSAADSVVTYKSQLSDLSATIFSVENQFQAMSSNAILQFTCKDWKFQIYKYNSSTSEMIASGKDILTVDNYKKLTEDGYRIAVVLYNDNFDSPFEHSKEYEMDIRLKTQVKIKTIDIGISYTGTFNETYPEATYSYHSQSTLEGIYNGGDNSVSGNTFSSTTVTTVGVYNQTSNISVTFDDITNPTQILQFSINNDGLDTFVNAIIKESAVGQDVPFDVYHDGKIYQFAYYGNISTYLTTLTHIKTWSEEFTRTDGTTFTADIVYQLVGYDAQGSILINVEFE